jgi:glycosyltransferase involved in cell wall biosynthesis
MTGPLTTSDNFRGEPLVSRDARPIRTLHVDIEGGWGGSSRSLFELLSRLDRRRIEPIVAHRQMGPIVERYQEIGIKTFHVPDIVSFAPRTRKSGRIFLAKFPQFRRIPGCLRTLVRIAKDNQVKLIHLNHEGLFILAPALKRRLRLPLLCHSRILIQPNIWGRWLVRTLTNSADHMFFISSREEDHFTALLRKAGPPRSIVWNISFDPPPRRPLGAVPEAVYLGNIDSRKGTDRLIDIAKELETLNAPPLKIAVYGVAREEKAMAEAMRKDVSSTHLENRIEFMGYIDKPQEILPCAFALIRPSRVSDPWGRDVIEATSCGVPVLATGSYQGVIEHGVNGFLFEPFDACAIAKKLVELLEDAELWQRLSRAGMEKGRRVFSGREQVPLVTSVAESLLGKYSLSPEISHEG